MKMCMTAAFILERVPSHHLESIQNVDKCCINPIDHQSSHHLHPSLPFLLTSNDAPLQVATLWAVGIQNPSQLRRDKCPEKHNKKIRYISCHSSTQDIDMIEYKEVL